MGLTIHYSGSFRNDAHLKKMIDEIKDIVNIFNWKYKIYEEYFQHFEMFDEGQYWETFDEELLQNIFVRHTNLIDSFSTAIENYPKKLDETFTNYFQRLMYLINKENRDDNLK